MDNIVIIGGGVVGASAAYHLAYRKHGVTLIDAEQLGQATAAGAGIISFGTIAPPSEPLFSLAMGAAQHYPELLQHLEEDGEPETGYMVVGRLHVAADGEEERRLPDFIQLVKANQEAGLPNIGDVSLLNAAEARELFPPLGTVLRAVYISGVAHVNGRLLRRALIKGAAVHGANLLHGRAEVIRDGDRATAVTVEGKTLPADAVVIAAGAWTPLLTSTLGLNIPIYPYRGQILHLDVPNTATGSWPVVTGFHPYYLLAFPPERVVVGATREHDAGYDSRITAAGIHEITSTALRLAPGLAAATFAEMRVGLRPGSPDGLPVLGPLPGIQNVYVATGNGPSGLQLGPYSGYLIAELAQNVKPPIDLRPFAPDRFSYPTSGSRSGPMPAR